MEAMAPVSQGDEGRDVGRRSRPLYHQALPGMGKGIGSDVFHNSVLATNELNFPKS